MYYNQISKEKKNVQKMEQNKKKKLKKNKFIINKKQKN